MFVRSAAASARVARVGRVARVTRVHQHDRGYQHQQQQHQQQQPPPRDRPSWRAFTEANRWRIGAGAAVAGVALYMSIETIPFVDRIAIVPFSRNIEAAIGASSFDSVRQQPMLPPDHPYSILVRRIGLRILKSVNIPQWKWTFHVVDAPIENAFCLPGGHIVVYSGFFRVLDEFALHILTDGRTPIASIPPATRMQLLQRPEVRQVVEEALAVVLAHEVGHAIGHHSVEHLTLEMLTLVFDAMLGLNLGTTRRLGFFADLAFSRYHEREADHIGMHLLARACYHPKVAAAWWEFLIEHEREELERRQRSQQTRSGSSSTSSPPSDFLSTHPSHASRAQDCRDYLAIVEPIRQHVCSPTASGSANTARRR